jgi:hypothetical protein
VTEDTDRAFQPVALAFMALVAGYSIVGIWLATGGQCGGVVEAVSILTYTILLSSLAYFLPIIVVPVALWALFRFTPAGTLSPRSAGLVTFTLLAAAIALALTTRTTAGCPPLQM